MDDKRPAILAMAPCLAAPCLAMLCLAAVFGCSPDPAAPLTVEQRVRSYCATCHVFPRPNTMPRGEWRRIIEQMAEIARGDSEVELEGTPSIETCVAFYEKRAPKSLAGVDSTAKKGSGPLRLRRLPIRLPGVEYPGVTNVQFVAFTHETFLDILVCDARLGTVALVVPPGTPRPPRTIRVGGVPHPAHATVTDLDRDGRKDVLVANLGTLTPSDATNGSVEWLRGAGTGDVKFEKLTLASGLGRVADARAADFDGDGDLDVIVAVFGWRKVGRVLYLENDGAQTFSRRTIDIRPGAIHVPVVDLDGDGNLDFVALLAQQYETVVAFLGDGTGGFLPKPLFAAENPSWGASGLELVDLDRDGDLDVLLSNGDTLDSLLVRPYHGVQWLENQGGMTFAHRPLTALYGAHFAQAADMDGDGDLDIVASAFLPFIRGETPQVALIESIIWLEQISPGRFERFSIEASTPYHPTIAVGDFDADGDPDVVAGNLTMGSRTGERIDHLMLLLVNQRR